MDDLGSVELARVLQDARGTSLKGGEGRKEKGLDGRERVGEGKGREGEGSEGKRRDWREREGEGEWGRQAAVGQQRQRVGVSARARIRLCPRK